METNLFDPTAVDILLDETTSDLDLSTGEAQASRGLVAIAQGMRLRLSLWRREWFWNPAEGLPMLERILARGVALDDLKAVFNRALLGCPGVTSVSYLNLERDSVNRELLVGFEAKTANGLLASTDFRPFIVAI